MPALGAVYLLAHHSVYGYLPPTVTLHTSSLYIRGGEPASHGSNAARVNIYSIWLASEYSIPKVEHNVVSKQNSMTS